MQHLWPFDTDARLSRDCERFLEESRLAYALWAENKAGLPGAKGVRENPHLVPPPEQRHGLVIALCSLKHLFPDAWWQLSSARE